MLFLCICHLIYSFFFFFFFFNDTATTEIYTLSLHDALPIFAAKVAQEVGMLLENQDIHAGARQQEAEHHPGRSEEHTSELQSLAYLVCRLLLEKKKKTKTKNMMIII